MKQQDWVTGEPEAILAMKQVVYTLLCSGQLEPSQGQAFLQMCSVSKQQGGSLQQIEQQYLSLLQTLQPQAQYHVVSDVHIHDGNPQSPYALQLIAGLKDMKTICPQSDGWIHAGDFTTFSQPEEYQQYYQILQQYCPVSEKKVLNLLGNHDVRGIAGENACNWNRDPNYPEKCCYWDTAKELYCRWNKPYMPPEAQNTLYHAKTLGGYRFLMLNTQLGLKDAMYLAQDQLNWIEQQLQEAYLQNPQQPVFLVCHQQLNNTHWRSNVLDGFDGIDNTTAPMGSGKAYQTGMDEKLKDILKKYPTAIFLSGHIHNGPGVAEIVAREYGWAVDLPSFAENENGDMRPGMGYEVLVCGTVVLFRARNFVQGQWMPRFDLCLDILGLPWQYAIAKTIKNPNSTLEQLCQQAKEYLSRSYNQQALQWDSCYPPEEFLYHPDTHFAMQQLAEQISHELQKEQ